MLAGRAWAVLAPGEDWTQVHGAEVADSGRLLKDEAELRASFARWGALPPLPTAATLTNKHLEALQAPGFKQKHITAMGRMPKLNIGNDVGTLADIANSLDEILDLEKKWGLKRISRTHSLNLSAKDRLLEIESDWDYFHERCRRSAALLESKIGPQLTAILGRHQTEVLALADSKDYSGEALTVGFEEWFRLYVENPGYLERLFPAVTSAIEDSISANVPGLLPAIERLRERFLIWTQMPHPDARELIAADIATTRPSWKWSNLLRTNKLKIATSHLKSDIFWGVYLLIMHGFWIMAIAENWNRMGWYDLWVYAGFQYFYASIWPVWIVFALLRFG